MTVEDGDSMATLSISSYDFISREVARGLAGLPRVDSVHYIAGEKSFGVWIRLFDAADEGDRANVYRFEDQISQRFPSIVFDFHIVAVPVGRTIEEIFSTAIPIFQRTSM